MPIMSAWLAARLEVAAANQKVDLYGLALFQALQRSIDLVKLPVTAALHRNLQRSARGVSIGIGTQDNHYY